MQVCLLKKSKLEFFDGMHSKDKFDLFVHKLWEKYNPIVLSWIMNSVNNALLSGMVYATSDQKV